MRRQRRPGRCLASAACYKSVREIRVIIVIRIIRSIRVIRVDRDVVIRVIRGKSDN